MFLYTCRWTGTWLSLTLVAADWSATPLVHLRQLEGWSEKPSLCLSVNHITNLINLYFSNDYIVGEGS